MRVLKFARTGDRQTDDAQRNIEAFARIASRSPFWDGVLLANVALSTAVSQVSHGLGRAFQGWVVVRLQTSGASISVFEPLGAGAATQATAARFVPLQATGSCFAAVWVW